MHWSQRTPSSKHKRRLYTWTSPDGQHRNQIDYILCSQRWRSFIQAAKTRPGADCGSHYELLIGKFRLKLKRVGKNTRLFRYDLNHISYDYAVQVTNRFKGLDPIECLVNYGWRFMTLYRRQGERENKTKQKNRNRKTNKKRKMSIWRGLTNSCEKKRSQKQRRKGKIYLFEFRVPKKSKEW